MTDADNSRRGSYKRRAAAMKVRDFKKGIRDGVPIALGYVSVSFAFGIMGSSAGFEWWQTLFISMTNLTSAGQFAGLEIMAASGGIIEMALTQLVVNLRYALMSVSLSQKTDETFKTSSRLVLGFGITDEIFAVASGVDGAISRFYMEGLILAPYIGWTFGTLAGALFGNVVPKILCDAAGIAIYGMFLAIMLPKARDDKKYLTVIAAAAILSCCFKWAPVLKNLSPGFAIIVCAAAAALAGAAICPVED